MIWKVKREATVGLGKVHKEEADAQAKKEKYACDKGKSGQEGRK